MAHTTEIHILQVLRGRLCQAEQRALGQVSRCEDPRLLLNLAAVIKEPFHLGGLRRVNGPMSAAGSGTNKFQREVKAF